MRVKSMGGKSIRGMGEGRGVRRGMRDWGVRRRGTDNEDCVEKEDGEATLEKIGLISRLLGIVEKEKGLDNIKDLVEKNSNRKYNWLNDDMMTDIINNMEDKEYEN